ncbi:MAG: sodium:alanine symporter family protein [Oscillospiraceae bacterium]|nr:sodium:alanine symporter family protein [Oscillospiraceae bacterium]
MKAILDAIINFFTGPLNTVAWMYILLPCVLLGGIFFTVRNRGLQFAKLGYALKHTIGKVFQKRSADKGAVTPFQAVTTALAATVGTGNIIGTSQAIAMGGYGAIFWLWIAALLGMIIKYCEVVLSIKFRQKNEKGDWVGGPMYYITNGLGKNWKWLAVAFAALAALASFGIGNLSQANSISTSVNNAITAFAPAAADSEKLISIIVGVVIAVFCGVTLLGGIKRIGKTAELLVPFMSLFYIVGTLVVIGVNIGNIGNAFRLIFVGAFTPQAVCGAACGIAIKEALTWGLKRSAFSNEAGLGSAGIAHAAADTDSPVKQGLYGIFEVFADTLVICTLTGLAIIISGIPIEFGKEISSELITAALATIFGQKVAALFVAVALFLFAFSTILGWALYGTRCVEYLFGVKASKVYQLIFSAMVIVGTTTSLKVVWNLADTFNGLMAIPNFIALFALSGVVAKLTKDHFAKNPERLG